MDSCHGMKRLRSLLPLLLLIGIGVAAFASGALDPFKPHAIAAEQAQLQAQITAQPLLAALVHIGLMTLAISTGIPGGVVLVMAGGMLFGGWYGAVLSSIGATLGALVLYAASRFAFSGHDGNNAPALVTRLRSGYLAHPFSYTFFLRLVPFFPFGGVTVALAWLRCPLWLFTLATAIGGSVMTTIESLLGAGLAKNIAAHGGQVDSGLLLDPRVIGPLLLMAGLALIPALVNRRRAPPPQRPPVV
jgi:uncharacterized membrane protein YdjX (TVP38/TMEM64 family)